MKSIRNRFGALLVVTCAMGFNSVAWGQGAVLAWGRFNQSMVPAALQSGVTAIACNRVPTYGSTSLAYTLALKDGSIIAWGSNIDFGQCLGTDSDGNPITSTPIGQPVQIMGQVLTGVTAISAGSFHTIALKDGAVLAWGNNGPGQCNIPAAATSGVTAISAGMDHTLALKDGAVLAWGQNGEGQCNIPPTAQSGVSAISCSGYLNIALKGGKVFAWVNNSYGQCLGTDTNGNPITSTPIGEPVQIMGQVLTGVTTIAAGPQTAIAIKASVAVCPSDLDQSGEVDSSDLGNLLLDFGICSQPFCLADFDKSGEVDSSDLGNLLLDFGLCP